MQRFLQASSSPGGWLARLFPAAFAVGVFAVLWIAFGYVGGAAGTNPLALLMTLLIGAFFGLGAVELQRFRQATNSLSAGLASLSAQPEPPARLADWLALLHPSLHSAVRLRVEGERAALPGPALTPYITGLLVLLGMLGTFLGMVVTLNGTVIALESTTDVQSIRASLAAPVKGLGVAFGTSVAGVAASAMLGLMSALCRRERAQAGQALDAQAAGTLRVFSLTHQRDQQREATLQTLQAQARVMPEVVDRLQALMAQMERQSEQLSASLLAGQEGFHSQAQAAYSGLAASVQQSLKTSLNESAQAAATTVQAVVDGAMNGLVRDAGKLHASMAETWAQALARSSAGFEQGAATLLGTVAQSHAALHERVAGDAQRTLAAAAAGFDQARVDLQAEMATRDAERLGAWTQSLQGMASALQQEWQQAGVVAQAQTQHTLAEIRQLLQSAAEAPRAATEVIAQLRQQLSESIAHDNGLLEERSRIMATLATLLDAVNHASTEQRGAIQALVDSSAALLQSVGSRFTTQVEAESARLGGAAAQLTGSAVEVASLGEAFGHAVQLFSASNDKLSGQLQRMEGTLSKSIARSDEQLAYYVAQAREIIDLSLLSQKQIVEDLQRYAKRQAALAGEAA